MNVIVSNEKTNELTSLDIDVIKSITGEYNTDELISMFKTFFYEKMIVDVTAVKDYRDINTIERLAMGLGAEKLILLLTDELCTGDYLASLVDVGIYNFTNNINAIKRLIARPNTYDDVKKLQDSRPMSDSSYEEEEGDYDSSSISGRVIGFKNLTDNAGSTTLVYMLLKELKRELTTGVYALEVDKRDFLNFNYRDMRSVTSGELKGEISKLSSAKAILVDLNDYEDLSVCTDVVYLLEPSTIKLNTLIRTNPNIFAKMSSKKIVLNKSMLSNKDVSEFEYEANAKIYYNIPCLDDRADNNVLVDFLGRLGVLDLSGSRDDEGGGFLGIFKR